MIAKEHNADTIFIYNPKYIYNTKLTFEYNSIKCPHTCRGVIKGLRLASLWGRKTREIEAYSIWRNHNNQKLKADSPFFSCTCPLICCLMAPLSQATLKSAIVYSQNNS
jgi:hypothetical protein